MGLFGHFLYHILHDVLSVSGFRFSSGFGFGSGKARGRGKKTAIVEIYFFILFFGLC